MDRLDDLPLAPAPAAVRRHAYGSWHRATAADFARTVGVIFLAAIFLAMRETFRARTGVSAGALWVACAAVVFAAAVAASRILANRSVGFVPTLIICCATSTTLAALAYGIGEHVARWLT